MAHRHRRHKRNSSGLFLSHRSPARIEEHGSASSEHERRNDLDTRHLEGRKLHDSSACNGVNVRRYECSAAARRELLIIPEIITVALDC